MAAIAQSRRVRHQPGKLRHDQPSQERSCPDDSGNRRRPHRVVWRSPSGPTQGDRPMKFGFNAPTAGPMSAVEPLTKLVVEGEAMGFDYATFSDHVVIPTDIARQIPLQQRQVNSPPGRRAERHEQLIEMAFVAAKTTKLRLVILGDGRAASPRGTDRQDAVDHRRAVGRPADAGHRRRLDEGGVRGDPGARLSPSAARSPTNTSRPSSSSGPRTSRSSRQACPLRQHPHRAQAGAEAASADLGRRRERAGAAPHRQARRRLVSDRHQPAPSARQPGALQGAASSGCAR